MPSALTAVLCSSRESQPACRKLESELAVALGRRAGVESIVMPHVYDLAPDGPGVAALRAVAGDLAVLAWMPERALRATLAQFGVQGIAGQLPGAPQPSAERTIWCVDLRRHAAAEAVVALLEPLLGPALAPADSRGDSKGDSPVFAARKPRQSPSARKSGQSPGARKPKKSPRGPGPFPSSAGRRIEEPTRSRWYPVVDRQRCVNCLECLNFCLFGVYDLDAAGKVTVQRPDACRPGCPACARVCPSRAIMFPEYADPEIAGDTDTPPQHEVQGLDDLVDGLDRMEP